MERSLGRTDGRDGRAGGRADTHAIIIVRQLPPSASESTCVSLDERNGTCERSGPSPRAITTYHWTRERQSVPLWNVT